MSHLEKNKFDAVNTLKRFCNRCNSGEDHECPVSRLIKEVNSLRGIPIVVNDKLHHVMFT